MYLIYGLWILSFLNNKYLMLIFTLILCIRLFRMSYLKECSTWIICSILFLCVHQIKMPDIFSNYKVQTIKPFKVIISNGLNRYELKGTPEYKIGDYIAVSEIIPFETQTQYQKSKRVYGESKTENTHLVKRNFSIKRLFWEKLSKYKELYNFFDKEVDTIFSVLSLQLVGLMKLVRLLSKKFVYESIHKYIEIFLCFLYGYIFGWGFGVMRILLRVLLKDRQKFIPVLLIIYPYSFYDISFNLVFLPYIIKHFSPIFCDVNERVLRMFFLLRLLGKIHILEMIFYPLLGYYAGMILLSSFFLQFKSASFLLNIGMSILSVNRLLIVGAPALIWIIIYVTKDIKKQIINFSLMLLFICYFPYTRINMINVYQGDATLISLGFNSLNILVDTGRKSAYPTLKKSLYKEGVKKLDYLVITHDDLDHSENKEQLIKDFNVKYVIERKDEMIPFMTQLLSEVTYEDANENSLILLFKEKNLSFLITGDAGVDQEKELVRENPNLDINILKLGHHGSKTSTSEMLIENIKPKLALISSDPRIYNHPHPEVMKRLQRYRIPSMQTSIEGDIRILILPFLNIVVSEAGGFGIMK